MARILVCFTNLVNLKMMNVDDDDYVIYDAVMLLYSEEDNNDAIVEEAVVVRPPRRGCSQPGKAPNVERLRVFYGRLLHQDFWGPTPVYSATYFKLFFKLPLALFDEILNRVVLYDSYFLQKEDAARKLGLTPHQKICSAVRQLTSGVSPMEFDDKYRMGASTGMEAMKRYCSAVVAIYSDVALRHPTKEDIDRLLDEGNDAGFHGCIGSIDCMHWNWKNCPSVWKGMFQGKSGKPTVILEAIADHSCRFWHFNFGNPGSMNDINVLDRSPLFANAVKGQAPQVTYTVNGNEHHYAYWLADGIYPTYASFVMTVLKLSTRRGKLFAAKQEA
jgi:Plant transposon protein